VKGRTDGGAKRPVTRHARLVYAVRTVRCFRTSEYV